MKTRAICFPFDLFGSRGTGAGAELLADALREMLADNRREKIPTRARAYTGKLTIEEIGFATLSDYGDWRTDAGARIRKALRAGDFLLWITGNHLGTLPLYEELAGEGTSLVVQFDAHLDVYNLSDCTSELSHGNFLLHAEEKLPPIVNLGNRELLLRPEHINRFYEAVFPAVELVTDPAPALAWLRERARAAKRIVLDVDCDVFDPAYFPATTHPLPFGLSPPLFLRLLEAAWSERVVGLAISEFDPARDQNDRCLGTLLWLVEYLLLKRHERSSVGWALPTLPEG